MLPKPIFAVSVICLLHLSTTTLYGQKGVDKMYEEARAEYYDARFNQALVLVNQYLYKEKSVEGYYLQAMIHESMGETLNAISALTSLIKLDGEHLDAYFKRGELYYQRGIYQQALADFDYILDFEGNESTAAVYYRIDPRGQEQVRIQTLATMKGQVFSLRGLTYQAIGNYDQALNDMSAAIGIDSSAQNHVNRALIYREMNRHKLARENLLVATSLDPDLVIGWYNLMLVDPGVAIPEHIMSSSEFIPMLSYRAVEAFQNEEYQLAEALFTKALIVKPTDPLLLVNAGRLAYRNGNFTDAIAFYRKVLDIEPGRFESLYLIGNAFFQIGEFTQAAAYYEQYLARDRSDGGIWYNTALAYFELDDEQRGCECLQNAAQRGMDIDASSSLWQDCQQ